MKRTLILAATALMTLSGAAFAAGSSPQSNADNPYASRNEQGGNQPGSAATQSGSMRNPGGNRGMDSHANDPTTGVPQHTNRVGPQSGPARESSGSTGYGTPATGSGAARR